MESRILAEPILVGREKELEHLHCTLRLVSEGKGKTVFITAEAGVGKTRLLNEFIDCSKRNGNTVILSASCLFNAGIPYFPFIEAFSTYFSSPRKGGDKEELGLNFWLKSSAEAELNGKLQYMSPQALKDQTFLAVSNAIRSIASQSPVIIAVEDIHWADSASLALLHYIARAIKDCERVLVLATFRIEELTHNSQGYPHQLVETLAMMRREDLFEQMNLPNLNPAYLKKMAENILGGTLRRSFAEKLVTKSDGNPLFVIESLRMLHGQKRLVQENGQWNLSGQEIEIPSKMRDIIIQRLACLNSGQRRILDAASVIGDEFEAGLLSALVSQDSLEVVETLNAIAQSTSIVCIDEDNFRFDHARSREIIYGVLSAVLRRCYHAKIAEILEKTNTFTPPLSELAFHFARAKRKDKAIKFALAAAKDEYARWSNVQAIQHFRYVLENISEGYDREKIAALEGLGDAYVASYRFDEAIKMFDKLAGSTTGLVRLRAIRKAMGAAFSKGDKPDLLVEYAKKAEALAVDDQLEMARVCINRARAFGWSGRGDVKMELLDYDSALMVFEEQNSLADIAEALWRSGAVCLFFEDLSRKGLTQLLRSAAIFKEIGYIRKEIQSTVWVGDGFMSCGFHSEAKRKLNDVLRMGQKMDVFGELAGAHYYLGIIAESAGDFTEALTHSLRSLDYSEKTDLNYLRGFAYSSLTRQYSKLGNLNCAEKYFEKLTRLPPEILSQVVLAPQSLISKAVYLTAKGLWQESNEVFEKVATSLKPSTVRSIGNFARQHFVWMLDKQHRLEEAEVERKQIRLLTNQALERFRHIDIQLSVVLPRKLLVGKEFTIRLDFVNASVITGILGKIEGIIPFNSQVTSMPSYCRWVNDSLEFDQKRVDPFEVETTKLTALFLKEGVYKIEPLVFYSDENGSAKTAKVKSIIVTVETIPCEGSLQSTAESRKGMVEFKSEAAEKAFNYLVTAFEEDRSRRKLSNEKSGWRTLMEVVRNAHVSKHSMYGQSGRGGEATAQLRNSGLVESRFFTGERARGGKLLKIRVRTETNR